MFVIECGAVLVDNPDLKAGVTSLAKLLNLPEHPDHFVLLQVLYLSTFKLCTICLITSYWLKTPFFSAAMFMVPQATIRKRIHKKSHTRSAM